MNSTFTRGLFWLALMPGLFTSCNQQQNNSDLSIESEPETVAANASPEEQKIKATVDTLLFNAGNYNVAALNAMLSNKAMLGITSFKDGIWSNSEIAINDFFQSVKEGEPSPYCEIPNDYNIIITEDRLALVRADCILYRWGIPQTREVNHFTLLKENDSWKILNISWTKRELSPEKKKYNLEVFARGYAQAWSSQRPSFVASFFAQEGLLMVNNAEPAIGTKAITNVAKGFMETFPDMVVAMDSLITNSGKTRFYWTLTGTNNVPNGTGNKVKISGFEEWMLNKEGLIQESKGQFDSQEYARQLELGIATITPKS